MVAETQNSDSRLNSVQAVSRLLMFLSFHTDVRNGYVTWTLSFGGFIEGLANFGFAIGSKLMGSLDLEDLASASQDGSTSRLISTPTLSIFLFHELFSVINHPQF